ncbi:MAG: cyclodeaminase/cyclohydrolase family protein [Gemmatimonadales bacterium]
MSENAVPAPETPLAGWLDAFAAAGVSPAGGSAAAIGGALAAALAEMVAGITRKRERYASAHERAAEVVERAAVLRGELLALAVRDAEVFGAFFGARGAEKERVLRHAADVQLAVLRGAAAAAELAATIAGIGATGALADAATGTFLAAAAARSAYWAMRADIDISTSDGASMSAMGLKLVEEAEAAERRVGQIVSERIR